MAQEHGDIFAGDDALNLDRFKPKPAGTSDRPGPQDLRDIAMRHAHTTRRVLVRGDGSTAQEGIFDTDTGEFLRRHLDPASVA